MTPAAAFLTGAVYALATFGALAILGALAIAFVPSVADRVFGGERG